MYFNGTRNFNKKIYKKNSTIPSCLINKDVKIYKGNSYVFKKINRLMVGYKYGEFVFTRKPFFFPVKKAKKNNIKR